MIEKLGAILESLGLETSPEVIADVLWLAPRIVTVGGPPGELVEQLAPEASDVTSEAPAVHAKRRWTGDADIGEATASTYYGAVSSRTPSAVQTGPARVPAVRAIPEALPMARALRPFKRRRSSTWRLEFDVAATVAAIAESGVIDVVQRRGAERWLDLVLIVDDGMSMRLWQQAVGELRTMLARLGAFRTMRCHGLDATGCTARIHARPFAKAGVGLPSSGTGAIGRTVTLVVSDCVGPAWRTGSAQQLLARWARTTTLAVVQPLPPRLWTGTGVGPHNLDVRSREPAGRNRNLVISDPLVPASLASTIDLPVPVLELTEVSMRRWAQLVTGAGATVRLPIFDAGAAPFDAAAWRSPSEYEVDSVTGQDRLRAFRAAASPGAYRLAAYLAAISPLTLPVMHMVQHVLIDATRTHLAEVFLGGLLRRCEDPGGFDFQPGVRLVLLDTLDPEDAYDLIADVGIRIQTWSGGGPEASALRAAAGGMIGLPPEARPFAVSGAPLSEHLSDQGSDHSVVTRPSGVAPASAASVASDPAPVPVQPRPERPRSDQPHIAQTFRPAWSASVGSEMTPLWDDVANVPSTFGTEPGIDRQVVRALAYTPDGAKIITCGHDGIIRIRDARTRQVVRRAVGPVGGTNVMAISPDGAMIVTAGINGGVWIWDPDFATLHGKVAANSWESVTISPDGKWVVTGDDDGAPRFWTASGTSSGRGRAFGNPGTPGVVPMPFVKAVTFSPDGAWIITGSYDGRIQVWDVARRVISRTLPGHDARVNTLTMTSDGTRIISGGDDGRVRIREAVSGKLLFDLLGHTSQVNVVTISPDGTCIASGGDDRRVVLWNLATGRQAGVIEASGTVFCCGWSPDGRSLAIGGDHLLRIYDIGAEGADTDADNVIA